jgi:hypothetical protein
MSDQLRFHPRVVEDLKQAISWYDEISIELGNRFRSQVNAPFDEIALRPTFFAFAFANVRFAIVRRFPYLVLFREMGEVILVLGIFHSASDPAKWQKRAAD